MFEDYLGLMNPEYYFPNLNTALLEFPEDLDTFQLSVGEASFSQFTSFFEALRCFNTVVIAFNGSMGFLGRSASPSIGMLLYSVFSFSYVQWYLL